MVDIFEVAPPQDGKFFSFKNVGDRIQGTYVDFRFGKDGFGNEQVIYTIKNADGVWNVGFKKTSTVVLDKMKNVSFGQIVGFSYDELRPNKIPGRHPAKIIRVFADPQFVDKEWMEKRKEINNQYSNVAEDSVEDDGEPMPLGQALPTNNEETDNATKDAILKLAVTKKLVPEGTATQDAIILIETYTGLKLTPENYTNIIVKLSTFSA